MTSLQGKNQILIGYLLALCLSVLMATPVNAGLFDAIDGLTKKIAQGSAAANEEVDDKFSEELRKEMTAYDFNIPAANQSAHYIKVKNGDTIENVKKVGIINFSVEFVVGREATATGSSRSKSITLNVVQDTAKMQAMVESLYNRTVSDLNGMGIEIVPFETIKATRHYGELAPVLHPSPWTTETNGDVEGANGGANSGARSVFVAPAGMGIFMDNPKRFNESLTQGLGMMFGTNIPLKVGMIGYDLNREVVLLSVNMVVDFSVVKSSGRSLLNVAKIKSADMHHLHAENSYFKFLSTRGSAPLLTLNKTVVSDKPLLSKAKTGEAEIKDSVTSTEITVDIDRKFDKDTYYKRSGEMLEAARQMFIAELKKALPKQQAR